MLAHILDLTEIALVVWCCRYLFFRFGVPSFSSELGNVWVFTPYLFFEGVVLANTKGAIKRAKQSISRHTRNVHYKSVVRGRIRAVREAVASGDKDKAASALVAVSAVLHKVAGKGIMPTATAGRKLSRLAASVNKMG